MPGQRWPLRRAGGVGKQVAGWRASKQWRERHLDIVRQHVAVARSLHDRREHVAGFHRRQLVGIADQDERGAIGDAAWRDVASGELMTKDLEIPLEILHGTATQLLSECGQLIRRLVAGLSMPDWPEGARRAITVSLGPVAELAAPVFAPLESLLDRLREADAMAYEHEGD